MANEVYTAINHAFYKLFEDGVVPSSFLEDNRRNNYDSFFKMNLYFADDDSVAGNVMGEVQGANIGNHKWIYYMVGNAERYCFPHAMYTDHFKGRQLYMASVKDKTKWKVDIEQKPTWSYNTEKWSTYFNDMFNNDWDNVGKYFYENKSKLPFNLGTRTLRMEDSDARWVILKDGMLMNLDNHSDKAEFDDSVTLRGIPIQYIVLHMLPRLTKKFQSKVEIIQKLKDRIGNKYTKSVIVMQDNGDLRKYTFTACHVYWGATELTIDQIQQLVDNPNAWNGDSLKRLPV